MPYRFATENQDYSDYAGGQVFYSAPGHPALPVRLTSEIFQRCLALRHDQGLSAPAILYDPCCGSAYHLSALAYLHWHRIDTIVGSDIDAGVLAIAARNLGLLTPAGLHQRRQEIAEMLARYGKPSHAAALQSTQRFLQQCQEQTATHQVTARLFCADATDSQALREGLGSLQVDIVLSDVPYGGQSAWQQAARPAEPSPSPLWQMLAALRPLLSPHTIVAIAADKTQRCAHEQYRRRERFRIGKRQIVLLQPIS